MGFFKLVLIYVIAYFLKARVLKFIRYFNKYDFIKNNAYLNVDNYLTETYMLIIIIGILIFIF